MPSTQVYTVDFGHGNLAPSLDSNGWGAMKLGNSGSASNPTTSADPQGLTMGVTAAGTPAAIGAYIVLAPNVLNLQSRLLMRTEFDRPDAQQTAGAPGVPEPWAVALNVKFGDENFVANEPMTTVTCQFNRQFNGVRLNTPGHLEGDPAAVLVSPLNYPHLSPGRLTLAHYFCGRNAAGRYSTGFGTLSISPPIALSDERLYSSVGLSGGQQTWIGALGITVVTLNGVGRIAARLRNFTVWMW
jgi:hypothetical protein